MFKFFGAVLGVYVPMKLLGWDAFAPPYDLRRDLRASSFLLGVIFLLSLLKRYLWELYFGGKKGYGNPEVS